MNLITFENKMQKVDILVFLQWGNSVCLCYLHTKQDIRISKDIFQTVSIGKGVCVCSHEHIH